MKFDHSIVMQIPVCLDERLIDSLVGVWQVIKMMSKDIGGTRIWLELGTYINRSGRLAIDLNIWVKSQMDEKKFSNSLSKVLNLASQIRKKLRQEAIVVEINGDLEFQQRDSEKTD